MGDGGKGDKRRPEDHSAFESGYDRVFGASKPQRGRFIWDQSQNKLVPESEYNGSQAQDAGYYVMPDIQPYKSMQTGEMVQSRSRHKEILRDHKLLEIGNETKYLKQKQYTPPSGLKQTLVEVFNSKLR